MKILFNIGHPAQVHLFKNLIWNLEKRGHECKITTVDKEVSLHLLKAYGFDYEVVGTAKSSLFSKATEMIKIESKLYKIANVFNPDILVGGVGNVYVAHVGKLKGKPSIVFDDTEHAKIEHLLMDFFASIICTPSCYKKDLGKKQIRYNGYHELAYLHPNYFTPNPAVLDELGLSKDDTFIILRFVSWSASHDIGQHGIRNKIELVRELEKYGRVFITSEGLLPKELEKYKIKISPEKIHDVLYYANLYIGESGTMATEAAILGTPSVRVSTVAKLLGNCHELRDKYGLLYFYENGEEGLKKGVELLEEDAKKTWEQRRDKMLKEKIDVTKFMIKIVLGMQNHGQNKKKNN